MWTSDWNSFAASCTSDSLFLYHKSPGHDADWIRKRLDEQIKDVSEKSDKARQEASPSRRLQYYFVPNLLAPDRGNSNSSPGFASEAGTG